MLLRCKKGWHISENAVTDYKIYKNRRQFLKKTSMGIGAIMGAGLFPSLVSGQGVDDKNADHVRQATQHLYPGNVDTPYRADRDLTEKEWALKYNNFYEYGSHKEISDAAQSLKTHPWQIKIDGLVEKPFTIDFTDLIKKMPLEQRIYRHRCVEAWAMTVPWNGFALKELVRLVNPKSGAKYLRMETVKDNNMPGLKQFWYPWPYVEGLTMDEATNELAFIATGMYGDVISRQNGAPLRLVVPWKYGFKSIKSIIHFTFTDVRPVSFWQEIQGNEYGFWANVNPDVPHKRWSQASERLLGNDVRVPTRLYNGYGEHVAHLYENISPSERLFT